MKTHCFPDSVMLHSLTLTDGSAFNLYVEPSETFGHALARTGINPESVACIAISGPLHYEPDNSVATR